MRWARPASILLPRPEVVGGGGGGGVLSNFYLVTSRVPLPAKVLHSDHMSLISSMLYAAASHSIPTGCLWVRYACRGVCR